ncbi:UNVERIFIED_CONTAM: Cytochrome P450 2J2 [Trichonephila clavipes]
MDSLVQVRNETADEINHFLDVLKKQNGQPIDVKKPLSPSMSNNICALVFGKRYDFNDPDRQLLDKNLDVANESASQTTGTLFFPWLRFIPFTSKFLQIEKTRAAYNVIRKFFEYVHSVQYSLLL